MELPDKIKCISLWQPWATLMAIGSKKNETRSWSTRHRGIMAIHAAKKWNEELRKLCYQEPFYSHLSWELMKKPHKFSLGEALDEYLPFGAIVAVGVLEDCVKITSQNTPTGNEYGFGDYTPGRFDLHITLHFL